MRIELIPSSSTDRPIVLPFKNSLKLIEARLLGATIFNRNPSFLTPEEIVFSNSSD